MKKLLATLLLICLFCNTMVFAADNSDYEKYLQIANNSEVYTSMDILATDVHKDEENGIITFKNSSSNDTSLYIIDENTVFSNIPDNAPNLEWFLDGRAKYLDIVILKTDFYKYNKKENHNVYIKGIGSFYVNAFDVGGSSPEPNDEFNFIFAFGIMQSDGHNGFDKEDITRAEMAQVLANMLHIKNYAPLVSENEIFVDVDKNHWAYNAVYICKKMNLVSGYGNGYYGADDNITYEQAIKMLVSVLGYTPLAEVEGGYPTGYMNIANTLGITNGIYFVATDIATRENVARMIMNAVYLPVMEQILYGENSEYAIMDGTNGYDKITFFDKYFVGE